MVTGKEVAQARDVLERLLDGTREDLLGKYGREHLVMAFRDLCRICTVLEVREQDVQLLPGQPGVSDPLRA